MPPFKRWHLVIIIQSFYFIQHYAFLFRYSPTLKGRPALIPMFRSNYANAIHASGVNPRKNAPTIDYHEKTKQPLTEIIQPFSKQTWIFIVTKRCLAC
jgi:hypothetical protein